MRALAGNKPSLKPLLLGATGALALALGGCVYYDDGPGYYGGRYHGGYGGYGGYDGDYYNDGYYGGYYDGYYGPYAGGYWANDGFFYYWSDRNHYRRDHDRHFRRDHFDGGRPFRADRGPRRGDDRMRDDDGDHHEGRRHRY